MKRRAFLGAATLLLPACSAPGVRLDAPYIPTPYPVVDEMLRMAGVGPGDVVYDLGCGDGRIVIAAAQRFGARGVGVDLDPRRIEEAQAGARRAGVAARVRFVVEDLFRTGLAEATVVALYLFPELNAKLKPKFLAELRPGTRIVSHQFGIEGWIAERTVQVREGENAHLAYLWRMPPRQPGP